MKETSVHVPFSKPIDSRLEMPEFLLMFEDVTKFLREVGLQVIEEGIMGVIRGSLDSSQPSKEIPLFLKDITKSFFIPLRDAGFKVRDSLGKVWSIVKRIPNHLGERRGEHHMDSILKGL